MLFGSPNPLIVVFASVVCWSILHRLTKAYLIAASYNADHIDRLSLQFISFLFSVLICPAAALVLMHPDPAIVADPIHGFSAATQIINAVAVGFFTWNFAVDHDDVKAVVHHFSCWIIYCFGLTPLFHWMAMVCLLWELSTPFLCVRGALILLRRTDSLLFKVNNSLFALIFLCVRIGIGIPSSLWWWSKVLPNVLEYQEKGYLHYILSGFLVGNLLLNGLNIIWALQIIQTVFMRKAKQKKGDKRED